MAYSLVLGVVAVVAVVALVVGDLAPAFGFVAFLRRAVWIPMVAILVFRGQPVTPKGGTIRLHA
jgi:hypothetical protein